MRCLMPSDYFQHHLLLVMSESCCAVFSGLVALSSVRLFTVHIYLVLLMRIKEELELLSVISPKRLFRSKQDGIDGMFYGLWSLIGFFMQPLELVFRGLDDEGPRCDHTSVFIYNCR